MAGEAGIETIILPSILTAWCILGSALMLWRRQYEVIRKRGYGLVLVGTFFLNLGMWAISYFSSPEIPYNLKPCGLLIWVSAFFLPLWLLPYPLRAGLQNIQYKFNQKKLRPKEVNDADWTMKWYPVIATRRFSIYIYVVTIAINACLTAIVYYTDPDIPQVGTYDECYGNVIYLEVAWAFLFFVDGVIQTYLLWRTQDAYELKRELRVFVIVFPASFITWMVIDYIPGMPDVSSIVIFIAGMLSTNVSLYFPVYLSFKPQWRLGSRASSLNSDHHKMNSRELFHFCLDTPALLEAFKLYTVELWCAENIQFYLQVKDFRKGIEEGRGNLVAEQIIDAFIRDNCLSPVNIDDTTRKDLIAKFRAGEVTISLFDEAEKTVLQQLRQDTFTKWRLSGRLANEWKKAGFGDILEAVEEDPGKEKRLSTAAVELLQHPAPAATSPPPETPEP